MASNVIHRFSGVFHAAQFSHRAARRSGGVTGIPHRGSMLGSQCRRFHRFQIPMAAFCHGAPSAAPASAKPAKQEAA